ncbi:hypothetical protein [Palaeococcus sp. (in: euryarchaeotes)]|uniref:hypothetical protein n=1 Tax=Palaeococcus sp. (in: euryarchaeotes) TaxID=2820298 RepID=UPI000F17C5F1|nr:hypothetical protein [Palaeococcus sp. (in: euryarchaeotes)]MCD6558928.1 hypothetical protein [Palaeococcus sp. (in: euryarchaeotes)]RLF78792.1 MAG: hypothetical protein DRN39_00075 [Thermococci archaeon]
MKPEIKVSPLFFALFLFLSYGTPLFRTSPIALVGFFSYFFGLLYFTGAVILVMYYKMGGYFGLLLVSTLLLFIESADMDRNRAPWEHYLVLILTIIMVFPTYALIKNLAPIIPPMEVTLIASLILLVLYGISRIIGMGKTK